MAWLGAWLGAWERGQELLSAVFSGNAKLVGSVAGSVAGSVGAWPGDPFCSIWFGNLMEVRIALLTQCLTQCRRGLECASWLSYTRSMNSDLHRTFDVYAAGSLYIGLSSGIRQLT